MKGIVFNILENMIVDKFGDEVMEEIYAEGEFSAAVPPFVGPETYADSDLVTIVVLLSEKSNLPVDELIYEFGKYMFPILAQKYPVFLQGVDSPIQFLGTVNDIIHMEVMKLFEGANPPTIKIEGTTRGQTELHYSSERKLCKLLEGLLDGTAANFGKTVSYRHKQCMKDGFGECILNLEFKG